MVNALTYFEIVGDLYYQSSHRLRPGKSDPMMDSNSQENRELFDEWMRKDSFSCAIAEIDRLIHRLENKESELERLRTVCEETANAIEFWCVDDGDKADTITILRNAGKGE
jgi:hypothetical protein